MLAVWVRLRAVDSHRSPSSGRRAIGVLAVAIALTLPGCLSDAVPGFGQGRALTQVDEDFFTSPAPKDNLDSPAVWNSPDGRTWILVSAKRTHQIAVYDGSDGRLVRRVGEKGDQAGQFRRPNGVAVVGDLLLVVERDNRRIQAFSLPTFQPVLSFGSDVLERPYGITAFVVPGPDIDLYVTDQTESSLAERVRHFRLAGLGSSMLPSFVRSFGDRSGAGILHKVESIAADPHHDRLLIADEASRDIKVYTLAGRFTGVRLGAGLFRGEPEGIALYACGRSGYWIATDQQRSRTTFHIFDRTTLDYIGAFRGGVVRNTDGVALSQRAHSGAPGAVMFYALHDDQQVAAIRWTRIAQAMNLPRGLAEEAAECSSSVR